MADADGGMDGLGVHGGQSRAARGCAPSVCSPIRAAGACARIASGATSSPPLVGRAGEREAIAGALRALRARAGCGGLVEGEPGIGKSRLLAHLAAHGRGGGLHGADGARHRVRGRPALRAVDGGARRPPRRGRGAPARAPRRGRPGCARRRAARARAPRSRRRSDRHRTHRALRDLLERLAASAPARAVPRRRPLGRSGVGRRARGAGAPPAARAGSAGPGRPRGPASAALATALRLRRPRTG